ncbi:unnamed protein product [Periconia digitata]|uniref:Uncharacterized protein n=1 Tax=Periconia digitata TaxID=1303443 RepID=A0A9W4U6X0_9PLEO|nr:unnamed protein product [Periconia digitata]
MRPEAVFLPPTAHFTDTQNPLNNLIQHYAAQSSLNKGILRTPGEGRLSTPSRRLYIPYLFNSPKEKLLCTSSTWTRRNSGEELAINRKENSCSPTCDSLFINPNAKLFCTSSAWTHSGSGERPTSNRSENPCSTVFRKPKRSAEKRQGFWKARDAATEPCRGDPTTHRGRWSVSRTGREHEKFMGRIQLTRQ